GLKIWNDGKLTRKDIPVGTRILVSIIVIVSVSIAIINLLTIYGIIANPGLLNYLMVIGIFMVPLVIIGATVNKIFIEEKKALDNMIGKPTEIGQKVDLRVNFKPWETTTADTSPHPVFYVKITIAAMLSVSTGVFILMISSGEILTESFTNLASILLPLVFISAVIHLFSKHLFEPDGWREFLEHTWLALLIIGISISFMLYLRDYTHTTYPRQFWESFMGLPFSLPAFLFLVISLLLGGILMRLGDFFELESSPLKASGITFVLASIAFMVPQFNFLDWGYLLVVVSRAFSIALVVYGIATSALLYKDAGMRYIITNERIIKLNTNKLDKSKFYTLDKLDKIAVEHDFLADQFGYGNVVAFFSDGKKRKRQPYCMLHGIKNPDLIVNTIKAMAQLKKHKIKPKKKIKKRPKKKKVIRRKKIKKKRPKKEDFYYRCLLPFLAVLLFGFILISGFSSSVSAQTRYGTRANGYEHIEEEYSISYKNTSIFSIFSIYRIYSYHVNGELLSLDELKALAQEDEEMVMDLLETEAESRTDVMLENTYDLIDGTEKSTINSDIHVDRGSLSTSPGPLVVIADIDIELKPLYFGLPDKVDLTEMSYGFLKIGGELSQRVTFLCEAGHKAMYEFEVPGDLYFDVEETEAGQPSGPLNTVAWTFNNTGGSTAIRETETLSIKHKDPVRITGRDMEVNLLVDIFELDRTKDREYLKINENLTAELFHIPLPETLNYSLPVEFNIDYINSDFIRLLYQNGLDGLIDDFRREIEEEINKRISDFSDTVVDGELELMGLDEGYKIGDMTSNSPIRLQHNSSFEYTLSEYDKPSSLKTRYTFSENIKMPINGFENWPLNYTIKIPEGLRLMSAKAGEDTLTPKKDNLGRYYIEDSIEPSESYDLNIEIGTVVDISTLFPFLTLIFILFLVWLGLNVYPIKKRRKFR
ncbi:MAG: hypothetical protein R6U61_01595, partial [Thermoplasmata archaeon]